MSYLSECFPKTNNNIEKMSEILLKYDFKEKEGNVYGSFCEIIFEYIGCDIISETEAEEDWEKYCINTHSEWCDIYNEYQEYRERYRKKVIKYFREALKEIDENGIEYMDCESCEKDFSCMIVNFKLE